MDTTQQTQTAAPAAQAPAVAAPAPAQNASPQPQQAAQQGGDFAAQLARLTDLNAKLEAQTKAQEARLRQASLAQHLPDILHPEMLEVPTVRSALAFDELGGLTAESVKKLQEIRQSHPMFFRSGGQSAAGQAGQAGPALAPTSTSAPMQTVQSDWRAEWSEQVQLQARGKPSKMNDPAWLAQIAARSRAK